MSFQVITALIVVFAALCGTTIGGMISYFTNRDLKKKEWQLSVQREDIDNKRKLYSEFLAEAYRLTLVSVQAKYGDLKEFNILNRYFAQIELLSPEKVVHEAKAIVDHVIVSHSESSEKKDRISFYDVKTKFINNVKEERHILKIPF